MAGLTCFLAMCITFTYFTFFQNVKCFNQIIEDDFTLQVLYTYEKCPYISLLICRRYVHMLSRQRFLFPSSNDLLICHISKMPIKAESHLGVSVIFLSSERFITFLYKQYEREFLKNTKILFYYQK